MRFATRIERTEEGKTHQKNMMVERTKKKYNEKCQQKDQQGKLVGDAGWQGKKIWVWRKLMRLKEFAL